jgi:hypothetical protein
MFSEGSMKKLLGYVLIALSLSSAVIYIGLTYYYVDTLPRVPNPGTGNIIELGVHSVSVYLTQNENLKLLALELAAPLLGIIGGLLVYPIRWDELM